MIHAILERAGAIFLAMVLMLTASLTLTGCNTTKGMGEDLEAAGEAISEEAEEKKKY